MQTLKFDDGVINLDVNESGRIFSFNPTDARVYEGFFNMMDTVPREMEKVSSKAKRLDERGLDETERTKEELKLYRSVDRMFRTAFDETFGDGQADLVFGSQLTCSFASNGNIIFSNALEALLPLFEKETKKRKEKIKSVINQYKD